MKKDPYEEEGLAKRKQFEEDVKKLNVEIPDDPSISEMGRLKIRVASKVPFQNNVKQRARSPMVLDDLDKDKYGAFLTSHFRKYFRMPVPQSDNDVERRIEYYFDDCESHNVKPTVEGCALAIGIDRVTFRNWADKATDNYDRYFMCKRAREILQTIDSTMVEANKLPPVPYIFRAKNNYPEYRDNQEVTIRAVDPLGEKIAADKLLQTIENDVVDIDFTEKSDEEQ